MVLINIPRGPPKMRVISLGTMHSVEPVLGYSTCSPEIHNQFIVVISIPRIQSGKLD